MKEKNKQDKKKKKKKRQECQRKGTHRAGVKGRNKNESYYKIQYGGDRRNEALFFFLSSLVSASGNRHVMLSRADSQPGGRSGGAGRGPSPAPARPDPPPQPPGSCRRPTLRGWCSSYTVRVRWRRGAGTVWRRARLARQRNLLAHAARSCRPLFPSRCGAARPRDWDRRRAERRAEPGLARVEGAVPWSGAGPG